MLRSVLPLVYLLCVRALRCLDNDGGEVDWWFMYKLPNGYRFAYNDQYSGDAASPLLMYGRSMDNETHPVAITRTLQALAEKPLRSTTPNSYYLYNDEPYGGVASPTYGHTKGVVAASADGDGGLWILHSTPHWPASTGKAKFYFPESEITFGQTFLCMSLDRGELDAVGLQQMLTRPYVYHKTGLFTKAYSTVAAVYPNLAEVLAGHWEKNPGTRTQLLNVGKATQTFTALAKNKEWANDLWGNLVAPHYRSGFIVESWMRGQALGPYCPPDHPNVIVDARTLYVDDGGQNLTWKETQDHAKWGVALDSSYVLCVGDLNRMESQRNRGGGAVCFSDRKLAYGLYRTIMNSDRCNSSQAQKAQKARWAATKGSYNSTSM